jgi:predicted nucleotidyltransferase
MQKNNWIRYGNTIDELNTIWEALHTYRENCIPESDPAHNKEWEDITYSMACIMEKLQITHVELDTNQPTKEVQ